MANPLVRQLGLGALLKRDADPLPPTQEIDDATVMPALVSHLRAAWGRNKLAKMKVDLNLLKCLRARRGVYSAMELAVLEQSGGLNIVYADLTETKCRGASAWIREIVLPTGERPWSVSPTPIPDLPLPFKKTIVAKSIEQAQQLLLEVSQAGGGTMDRTEFRKAVAEIGEKLREEAEQTMTKAAKKRAMRMERQIADRLAQGGWEEAMDAFVEDFVTYPAAIMKGPVYQRHQRLKWGSGFKPEVTNTPEQTWQHVSPFDVYPSPSAKTPQEGDFVERMRFWRKDLWELKGLPGYRDDQIDKALMDYSFGHMEGWLFTQAERARLEQETMYMFLSPPGVIDALNYWGSVPGWMLISWGIGDSKGEPLEPTRDYEINALLVGQYVIYCALNPDPLGQRPFRKACYDEIPGAFWGRSIPDLCAPHQKMCNAIACALADNLSIASGPMGWVHVDRLADGEDSTDLGPWRMFQLKSDPTQGVNPGIGFFQPADNSANLMATYEKWEIRADDATGIPRYTYGNERAGGSADTATGLSMLMNNAAKGLRRAISNIDMRVISPTIGQCFTNEMLYNEDESIKGDCIVVPRGAAAILIKESAQQRRVQFLGMTANPIDMAIIGNRGRAALLRETAASMELPVDEVVPSDEELQKREQEAAQAAQEQAQAQQQMMAQQQQLEAQKNAAQEQAKAQAAQQQTMSKIIGDIVKQAVAESMRAQQGHGEGKSGKKVKYNYGDDGVISGAELEEA